MGSVACSLCGHVRFTAAASCPECGAPPSAILPDRPSGLARARVRRPRIVDVPGRVLSDPDREGKTRISRKRVVELAVAATLAAAIALTVVDTADPSLLGLGKESSTDVVLPAGTTENLTGGNPLAWHVFQTHSAGTLEGSYSISGGLATVYVCNGTQLDGFSSSGPGGYTWRSGLVSEGSLNAHLNASETYLVGGWPAASTPLGSGNMILTWTSALEFVY